MANVRKLSALILLSILAAACSTPPEILARDAIVGAKTAIVTEQSKHPECMTVTSATPGASTLCKILIQATGAKDLAIDALEAYCSGPAFDTQGGACQPPTKGTPVATQLTAKLLAAVTAMNQITANMKTAAGGN